MAPLLTVGYSCLADRFGDIAQPPEHDDVEFVVCVQGGSVPAAPDWARVVEVPGIGVARSRNVAIDVAQGRYLLFCDDDVSINVPGVLAGVEHLQRSGHALALGQGITPAGVPRKSYPATVTALTRFNTAKAATYEMLVDLNQVRDAGVRFDERFGAGMPLHLGDEYIFITDLLRAGCSGVAIPEVFGTHPDVSSGDRWDRPTDAHARAVALNRVFGRTAPLARAAFAVKHRRRLGGPGAIARFVVDGTKPPLTTESRNP